MWSAETGRVKIKYLRQSTILIKHSDQSYSDENVSSLTFPSKDLIKNLWLYFRRLFFRQRTARKPQYPQKSLQLFNAMNFQPSKLYESVFS